MAQGSQARVAREDRLAAMFRWATAPLVIPLLTGLDFVATTVFAYLLCQGDYGHGSYGLREALPMAIFCLCVGVPLGFALRWGVKEKLVSRPGLIPVLAVVSVMWLVLFAVQAFAFFMLIMSL